MSIYRPYRYLFVCETIPCKTSVLSIEVPYTGYPLPAEAARRRARARGWKIRSEGMRRGWLTWCPEHAEEEKQ
jgi:hypothetical protein